LRNICFVYTRARTLFQVTITIEGYRLADIYYFRKLCSSGDTIDYVGGIIERFYVYEFAARLNFSKNDSLGCRIVRSNVLVSREISVRKTSLADDVVPTGNGHTTAGRLTEPRGSSKIIIAERFRSSLMVT